MKLQGCIHRISRVSVGWGGRRSQEKPKEVSRLDHWRRYFRRYNPTAKDFSSSMREVFTMAGEQVPSIIVDQGLVGGNPCISGTRIPVYMILDAIEYHGTMKGVLKSYPQLRIDQVRDAVRFSKIVMECCFEH